jgi:hypothetical protein
VNVKIIELVDNDYYSSSNDHVVIPDGMDINDELKAYQDWYKNVYCAQPNAFNHCEPAGIRYMKFFDWLLSKGARKPTDEEFGTFQE